MRLRQRLPVFLREDANKATATSTSTPEATLPNVDAGGARSSASNEVSEPSPRVTEMTPSTRNRAASSHSGSAETTDPYVFRRASRFATIHLNDELLQIEKFKYLLSYLTGAAKRAIEGIRLTEDNYSIAIKTLTERFGRRDLLINEHVDHLLALAPVMSSAEVENFDCSTTSACLRTSPYSIARRRRKRRRIHPLSRHLKRELDRLQKFYSFLRVQVEIREEGRPGRTASASSHLIPEEDVQYPPAPVGHLPTASALAPESAAVTEEAARCCYRCGSSNHMARFCRRARSIMCSKCHRQHLTILCELIQSAAPTRANVTAVDQDELCIAGRSTNTPPVTSASSALSGVNAVLLQTGQLWIESRSRRRLVRILLDSGSQRTFIRADLSKDLRCPVIRNEELSLVTFGHSNPREVMRSRRVVLTLRGQRRDIAVTVEALEVPEVCTVTSPPINTAELHKAEHYWLQNVQEEMFSEEAQALRAGKGPLATSPTQVGYFGEAVVCRS
ncbi:hypothetical protein HPB52_005049 [Rhipicephalus sanguineus]|uniref:CCHC-type domain-containing protein n=1 Tax=Rhipicephalus sanguineus TaxID=34632 RepID=A0A9D4T123_RHISA|nr:hypothetical protein HPB52_005049 [Rhipicephalus sanguineus]